MVVVLSVNTSSVRINYADWSCVHLIHELFVERSLFLAVPTALDIE